MLVFRVAQAMSIPFAISIFWDCNWWKKPFFKNLSGFSTAVKAYVK